MKKKKGSWLLSVWMGIGATWFGVHMGPGTASGRQGATFFSSFGTWSFVMPFVAMGILAFVIYMVIEYMRINGLKNYNEFFMHFFYPYEKIFSLIFDILFFFTYFMLIGAALFTGARIFADQFGLPYLLCLILIGLISVLLIMYGENVVRVANSFMAWLMLINLVILMIFALNMKENTFQANLHNPQLAWNYVKFWPALFSAIIYAAFQVTGNVGATAAVAQGLKSKSDSKKAAIFGWLSNSMLLLLIAIMHFGLQSHLSAEMPNYSILQAIGQPVLFWAYVVLVELAVISSIIGMNSGVESRINKFVPIKNPKLKSVIINTVFLLGAALVSMAGLTKIVNVGFTYLGYACLPLVILPILILGFKKVLNNKKESVDYRAIENFGRRYK